MLNYAPIDTYRRMLQALNALSRDQVCGCLPAEMLRKIVTTGMALLPLALCGLWRRDDAAASDVLRLEAARGGSDRRVLPPFMDLPYTNDTDAIIEYARRAATRFDNFVVLGIGGSALGATALHSALNPPVYNLMDKKSRGGPRRAA